MKLQYSQGVPEANTIRKYLNFLHLFIKFLKVSIHYNIYKTFQDESFLEAFIPAEIEIPLLLKGVRHFDNLRLQIKKIEVIPFSSFATSLIFHIDEIKFETLHSRPNHHLRVQLQLSQYR